MRKITIASVFVLMGNFVFAQSEADIKEIIKSNNTKELARMSQEQTQQSENKKIKIKNYLDTHPEAKEFGSYKNKDGSSSFYQLVDVDDNGTPLYYTTYNVNAAKATRTNFLNTGGAMNLKLNGESMNAYIWDGGGVRKTHVEMANRVTIMDGSPDDNVNRVHALNHATHVAGTMISTGINANAKGMASKALLKSYDWFDDEAEATSAVGSGMLVSNHSYGLIDELVPDYYFGAYINDTKNWDNIMFNAPYYLMVNAAGNGGTNYAWDDNTLTWVRLNDNALGGDSDAFDKLTSHSTSKNAMVVANAAQINVDLNGNFVSAQISNSSSQGPTDDLRIKPDITGLGTNIYSTFTYSPVDANGNYTIGNNNYRSISGTSMASPNVTGSLLLVQQFHKSFNNQFLLGAALKGLALHTADDAGSPGPDVVFGWGVLNSKKMIETISAKNDTSILESRTLQNNGTYELTFESDGVTPIKASISWYDRGGLVQSTLNDGTKRLVNDLDLRITNLAGTTSYFPWELTSRSTNQKKDNSRDNFERIDAGVLPAGTYKLKVSHKGILEGGNQNYTLILTGKKSKYCTSKANHNSGQSIENVTYGSINNTSTKLEGYENYTHLSTKVTAGTSQNISIKPKWAGTPTTAGYAVYVDWNQDGDFNDANETAFTKATSLSTLISGSITVPSNAIAGNTRMRVAMKANGIPTACETFTTGQVEDYTLNVTASNSTIDNVAPSAITNLNVSGITTNTANVQWTAATDNVGVVRYDIYLNNNLIGNTTSTSGNLNTLTSNTTYSVYVKAVDAAGNSTSSNVRSFTTLGATTTTCTDSFEPNNTMASAVTIPINTDVFSMISSANDNDDWFKFTTYSVSPKLRVDMTNLPSDYDIRLYNASGSLLGSSLYGGISNEKIVLNATTGSSYYIKVSRYGNPSNSCYNLKVTTSSSNLASNTIQGAGNQVSMMQSQTLERIYPNPVNEQLNITHVKANSEFTIYDLSGKLMMKSKLNGTSINVSGLTKGNYLLNVSGEQFKFIKN